MKQNQKPTGIAFFDFDKTILTVDSGPIYGVRIYRDGLARAWPSFRALFAGIGYKLGMVKRRSVARVGVAEYTGLRRQQIADWMRENYPKLIRPHLSKVMLERIRQHKADGFHVGIITASPPFFVHEAASELGMDYVFGSEMRFRNDICTGKYEGKYLGGPTKREVARRQAEALGLSLQDCWFYSDHVADIALLEAVGHPVVVGPEEKMRKIAIERGWPIVEHEGEIGVRPIGDRA